MGEQGLSSPKKKILYIGLFIVPFLLAMALIFLAKGLGTLPIMNMEGKYEDLRFKNPPQYYTVPEFQIHDFDGGLLTFSHADSVVYLVTMLPADKQSEWEKHILYIGEKIIPRATNVRVISLFEGDTSMSKWKESPVPYMQKKSDKWQGAHVSPIVFNRFLADFKTEINDSTGIAPYVMVDKEEHIRAHCNINDAKVARDIPKMFKILSNQYVSRKLDIKQVKQ